MLAHRDGELEIVLQLPARKTHCACALGGVPQHVDRTKARELIVAAKTR